MASQNQTVESPSGSAMVGMGNDEENDVELIGIQEALGSIENIMVAEKKRRLENNKIMNEFIEEYLKTLQESITNKVDQDFQTMKRRVEQVDLNLKNLEDQVDRQIDDVNQCIENKQGEIERDISQAQTLIHSIKRANEQSKKQQTNQLEALIKYV